MEFTQSVREKFEDRSKANINGISQRAENKSRRTKKNDLTSKWDN